MMIDPISEFANQFGTSFRAGERLLVEKENRYFLLNDNLKKLISEDFFYAGTYLGKARGRKFLPSFSLLAMLAEKGANKIVVDKKTEWLFICGRDIFKRGIMKTMGSKKKGAYALILNQYDECLGFGKIVFDLNKETQGVAVRNVLDIGDFLRRERAKTGCRRAIP
jgi:ribosome biogenesis protein Nip4